MTQGGEMRGSQIYKNFKISKYTNLENEKDFLHEVKRIFHNYFSAIIC